MEKSGEYPVDLVARVLMITPRRLQQLATQGIVPRAQRGLYPLIGCVQGYIRYLQMALEKRSRADGDTVTSLTAERIRQAREAADKIALENEIKRGNLVWRWQVQEVFQAMAADISSRLDALPGRVAGELAAMTDAGEIRARLLDECRNIRSGHAEYITQLANARDDPENDGEDIHPTATADAGRMGGSVARAAARKRRTRSVAK